MKWCPTIVLLAILAEVAPARGDLLYFARGGEAQLSTTIEGDQVRLEAPGGPRLFPRSEFLAIVPTPRPDQEWAARREAALKAGTVEARFAAAWWALENGLTREAREGFEALRSSREGHGPASRVLLALDSLAPPCPDPDFRALKSRLGPDRFRESRSGHVVLLHQLDDADAAERLDVLERVVQTFLIANAGQGVDLQPLRERIVSVYFADRRDYAQFLRLSDAEPFTNTQGYYHPTYHAVLAFDTRSGEAQRTGRRALANRRREGAPAPDLDRRELLLELDWRSVDLGIAAHETIHQLTIQTGLAPRFDDFPSWLHEGLAAQFEVVRGGRWAGFGRVNDHRLPDWRAIHPPPRLAPLIRDDGHGYRRDTYAESWALVHHLRRSHPREFLTFLDLLRAPGRVDSPTPDRTFDAFRRAFGDDLSGLESAWHRDLAGLATPLEMARPAGLGRAARASGGPERRLVEPDPGH